MTRPAIRSLLSHFISDSACKIQEKRTAEFRYLKTSQERESFTMQLTGEAASRAGDFFTGSSLSYRAFMINPLNLDAFFSLCRELVGTRVGSMVMCEFLATFRPIYAPIIAAGNSPRVNPYVRLLIAVAEHGILCNDIDTTVLSLEEVIRIRRGGDSAQDALVPVYLGKIGAQRTHTTSIVRTWEHLDALVKTVDKNLVWLKWVRIARLYEAGDDAWREEGRKANVAELEYACGAVLNGGRACLLEIMFRGWTDLLVSAVMLFSYDIDASIFAAIRESCWKMDERTRVEAAKAATFAMEEGISSMQNAEAINGFESLQKALELFLFANKETTRPSENVPTAVFTWLTKASMAIEVPMYVRFVPRIGLMKKPTCGEFYTALTRMYAMALQGRVPPIVIEISAAGFAMCETGEDCREVAKQAAGLFSLEAIVLAASEKLDREAVARLAKQNIDDCFVPITLPTNILEPLPWLTDAVTEYDI